MTGPESAAFTQVLTKIVDDAQRIEMGEKLARYALPLNRPLLRRSPRITADSQEIFLWAAGLPYPALGGPTSARRSVGLLQRFTRGRRRLARRPPFSHSS